MKNSLLAQDNHGSLYNFPTIMTKMNNKFNLIII